MNHGRSATVRVCVCACLCSVYFGGARRLCSCRLVRPIAAASSFNVYLSSGARDQSHERGRCCTLAFNNGLVHVHPHRSGCLHCARGTKPLSSASCVCDRSLIAAHFLCLWTQTGFSRCAYVTAKRLVSSTRDGTFSKPYGFVTCIRLMRLS